MGTDKVWFSVVPSGAGDTVSPNAGVDRDGSDGYSVSVNKLNYGAGLHDVAAIAWDDATSIATVSTQITIVQATVDPGDFAILP